MAKGAKPFKYRGEWRAQVTLDNGMRPAKDFESHADAVAWMADQLANANSEHAPALGGPTIATLADALRHYAELYTISKDGVVSELNRINHYLEAAGHSRLKRVVTDAGEKRLKEVEPRQLPGAFQKHNETRRAKRTRTYTRIALLANKRCSAISTEDIRKLFSEMKQEGLGEGTIQKEIAVLKHMFNMAKDEWNWKGFKNPCVGIKLGKSEMRFVFVTLQQRRALSDALAECDNPYFWPLVDICLQTTMRRSSLLNMRWDRTDLAGRIAHVPTKTGSVALPLTQHAVQVLSAMPRDDSGFVFPMSANAVDMAWDGVRLKAGLPKLQFRDLRHIGATDFARQGWSGAQLKQVLGHKTTAMADVYVNLVNQDVLDLMDRTAPASPVMQLPPPATDAAAIMLNRKRSERVVQAVRARLSDCGTQPPEGPGMSVIPA